MADKKYSKEAKNPKEERVSKCKKEIKKRLVNNSIDSQTYDQISANFKLTDEDQEILGNWIQKNDINILEDQKEYEDMKGADYASSLFENRVSKQLVDGFTKYLKDISQYPLLTPEEEKELGRRVRDFNDKEAFDKLMTSNLRLVVSLAKKIKYRGTLTFPDIVQEGNVGLAEAIPNYDPERPTSFASYSRWHIHHVMYRAVENKGRLIRIPVSAQADMLKINRYRREYVAMNGYEPSEKEIIENVPTINAKKVKNLRPHFSRIGSLDIPTGDGDSANVGDFIVDKRALGAAEKVNADFLKNDLKKAISSELTEEEQTVLLGKLGINQPKMTVKELSEKLKLEPKEISSLYARAIFKLKTGKCSQKLGDYYKDL